MPAPRWLLVGCFSVLCVSPRAAAAQDASSPETIIDAVPPGPPSQNREAPPPPKPVHTGLKGLGVELGKDFIGFPRRRSTWAILAVGAGAAAVAHPFDDNVNARLVGSPNVRSFFAPGKYVGQVYVQAGAATSLYVLGRYLMPGRNDPDSRASKTSHIGFDMLRAVIMSQAITQGIKFAVQRNRPTGECCSFPSGHASATFATASVLERHLGYRFAWPTILIATYVGTSRLHDNRHFLSDVAFGASVGVASGWTVVGRHGRSKYGLVPVPVNGGLAMMLVSQ